MISCLVAPLHRIFHLHLRGILRPPSRTSAEEGRIGPPRAGSLIAHLETCVPRKAAFDDMAICLDCRGNLVADARSGDLICEDCALVQGGSLNVIECRHDFFHDGGPLETVSYEAPPQQPSCKVPWFSQVNWTPSALPALCRSEGGEVGDEGPKVLRKIGKKVNEELAQANQIVELLGLPAVVSDTAREYLTICLSKKLQRGSARQGTVLASVFHACQAHGAPRTARELAAVSGVDVGAIKNACKRTAPYIERGGVPDMRPEDLMARCCANITSDIDAKAAKSFLIKCKQQCASRDRLTVLQGKTPSTVAAVMIWKVVQDQNMKISRQDISSGCGITVGTLMKAITEYDEQVEAAPVRLELDLNL